MQDSAKAIQSICRLLLHKNMLSITEAIYSRSPSRVHDLFDGVLQAIVSTVSLWLPWAYVSYGQENMEVLVAPTLSTPPLFTFIPAVPHLNQRKQEAADWIKPIV